MLKFNLKYSKQDWLKITYKLFFGLGGLGIILGFWIQGLTTLNIHGDPPSGTPANDYWNYFALNGNTYSVQYFSYFTIQSNLLCIFIFIAAGLFHNYENKVKFLKHGFVQAIAVYITITCIIFNGLLLPQSLASGSSWSALEWFQTMWQHSLTPLAFIIYFLFLFNNRKDKTEYKFALKYYVWRYTIYLLIYMLFILIKGYLIEYTNHNTFLPNQGHFSYPGLFQYFFLDFSKTTFGLPGFVWFIITFFIVLGLEIGFVMLYTLISNYRITTYEKNIKKNKTFIKNMN